MHDSNIPPLVNGTTEPERLFPEKFMQNLDEKNDCELKNLHARVACLGELCERQQLQLQELQAQLLTVLNTTWWRIGEPFRLAGRRFPRIARCVRYTAWSIGKLIHYYRKNVLRERLTDYMQRRILTKRNANCDLAKILGMPTHSKIKLRPTDIVLPQSETPVVSIVIPSYGKVDFVLRCLASIANSPPKVSIEVILSEDASGDPEVSQLNSVRGLRFIDRKTNLGFLRCSNDAVTYANGEFIFLLNNDTEVMPGAIDAMVALFRARPDAGLVGARLIYGDGRLQEAGAINWKDGSAWNYGRFDDPRRPEYNYVREADYISGAAIMLPRSVWDRIGGFDELYAPAYCEDNDLAMRVRREGLKVLYQPNAWVVHHEGISHGTDTSTGVKANQIQNGQKLVARWQDVFATEHYESGTRIMRARDKAMNKKIVLVIDHYVPEPDRDAGSRTIIKFIETLVSMGRVVKFWPANGNNSLVYAEVLQQMGVEVLYGPWEDDFANWIKKNGAEIDEVLLSRPTIAPMFLPALRKYCKAPVVFYGHDLHFMRMEKEAEVINDSAKFNAAQEMKELEQRVWLSVDRVLYPSKEEAQIVAKIEPSVPVSSISPYAFDDTKPRTVLPVDNSKIIFVAGFRHSPNVDAAIWLCNEVLPHVHAIRPDVHLTLVGSNPTRAVQNLAGEKVAVTGYVSDEELTRYYSSARVAVAPMRYGAGVKMKVVEALKEGIPLVTTSTGVQGLEDTQGIIDVHDDAKEFAQAILRLIENDVLWMQRSKAQADYVKKHFSNAAIRRELEDAFASVSQRFTSYGAVA